MLNVKIDFKRSSVTHPLRVEFVCDELTYPNSNLIVFNFRDSKTKKLQCRIYPVDVLDSIFIIEE